MKDLRPKLSFDSDEHAIAHFRNSSRSCINYFEDINGFNGCSVLGLDVLFLITWSATSGWQSCRVQLKSVISFSPFHNVYCEKGFIVIEKVLKLKVFKNLTLLGYVADIAVTDGI